MNISPSSLVVAGVGTSYQLSLSGKFNSGADVTSFVGGVKWSSSDSALATVDATGLVTVRGKGSVKIVAEYFGAIDSVLVEIVDVSSLDVFPANVKATALNQSFTLNVVAKDMSASTIAAFNGLNWLSSDPEIASVDSFGEITVHAIGVVSISATYEDIVNTSIVTIDESAGFIDGVAQYEDKLYDVERNFITGGFVGYDFKAIRFATVELLDANDDVFFTTSTDENGGYRFGNVIPDTYSVRLIAEVKASPAAGFSVRDMQSAIYSYRKNAIDNILTYDFRLGRSLAGAGAFNVLDVAVVSAEYANDKLNVSPVDLSIFWEKNYGLAGTYYCTGFDSLDCFHDEGIYLISEIPSSYNRGVVDADEFDDDVIMHEFGHFLTSKFSVDDSPGGQHYITQDDSDLRLSWSEGWGIFFPSAVKYWLESTKPALMSSRAGSAYYVDTVGNEAMLSHNIAVGEVGGSEVGGYYYASSEAAVGRILWNILTSSSFDMPKIWDAMVNYFPISGKPTSLPVFWDGLLVSDLYFSSELPELESIFEERKVIYQLDAAESDDTVFTATNQLVNVVPTVTNTLYSDPFNSGAPISDVDFFTFDAIAGQSYIVLTTELYNGVDTRIRLYEPSGTMLAENDDAYVGAYLVYDRDFGVERIRNNTTAMASEISFTAAYSGKYIVAVSDADKTLSAYDFVGHYGSYKLVISTQ